MDNKILLSIILGSLIVLGIVYIYIFATIDVKIITNKKYIEDDSDIIKKDTIKTLIANDINYMDVNISKYSDDLTQITFKSKTNRLSVSDTIYINNIVNILKTKSEVIKKFALKSSDDYLKNSTKINLVYILNKTYLESEQDIIKKEINNVLTDENIYDYDITIEKNSDNNALVKLNIDYYKTDLFTEKDLLNLIDKKFSTSLFSEYNFISKTNYDSNNTNIVYEFVINVKYKDQNILNDIKNVTRIKNLNNVTITLDKYIDRNTYMKLDIFYNKTNNFDDKELLRIINLNFSQNPLLKNYSLTLKSEYDKNLYHLDLEYLLNKPYDKEDLNALEKQLLSLILLDKLINDANVIFDKYINGIIHIKILIFYNIKVLDTKIVLNNFLKNIKDYKNDLQLNSGIRMNLISDVELKSDRKNIEYIYTEKYTSRGYYDPNKYKTYGSPDLTFEDLLEKCNNDSSCFGVQEIDGVYNICNSITKRIYNTIGNGMYIIKTKQSTIPQPVSYTEPEKDKILKNSENVEYINRKDKLCSEIIYETDNTGLTLDKLITKCNNDKNVGGTGKQCSGIKIKNNADGSQDIYACTNILNTRQDPSKEGQEFTTFLQNKIPLDNKIFNIAKQNEEFKTDKNIDYVFKNDKLCMLKGPLQRAGLTLNQTMDLCNESLNINGFGKTCKGILIEKDKIDPNLQNVFACLEYQNNLYPSTPVNTSNYIFKKNLPIDNIKYKLPDFSKQYDSIEGKTVDNIDYLLTNKMLCNGFPYDLNGAPTLDEAIKKCDNEHNLYNSKMDCIGLKFKENADGSQTVSTCSKDQLYYQQDDYKNKTYFLKNKLPPVITYPKLNYPNNDKIGVINGKTTSGLDYVYTNKVNCSATSQSLSPDFYGLDINQALDKCKTKTSCIGISIYDDDEGNQVKELCTNLQEGPGFRGYDKNNNLKEAPNLYLIKSMVPEIK
jgi:hypothetical protein